MQYPPLPDWFWYPITFLYGAIVGSFLNVVIYRLPLGRTVWGEPSHCPNCNYNLRAWDNIPILGFLLVGGKCRYCRVPISWRYMTVELLTACLWVALYDKVSNTSSISWVDFVGQALFGSVLIAMVFIDLDHFIAPDELNIVGFALALARDVVCLTMAWMVDGKRGGYVWEQTWPRYAYFHFLPRALIGGLVYGGALFAVSLLGFLYYARLPDESVGSVLRRFWTFETVDEEPAVAGDPSSAPEAAQSVVAGNGAVTPEPVLMEPTGLPPVAPSVRDLTVGHGRAVVASPSPPAAVPPAPDPVNVSDADGADTEAEEEAGEPPLRLRFSPGLVTVAAAALLATVVGWWALLVIALPSLFYVLFARREAESAVHCVRRFFQPDSDDEYAVLDPGLDAAANEAEEFAREAETGQHGGMGLGDAKLAIAIGGLLGPALAILSLLVATFIGAVTGIGLAVRARRSLRYGVPFVPFMAVGAIVTMLYGTTFVNWYLTLLHPQDPAEIRQQQQAPRRPRMHRSPGSTLPPP